MGGAIGDALGATQEAFEAEKDIPFPTGRRLSDYVQ
jgi:hypothetical protein